MVSGKPKISVVIPVCNVEKYVGKCIRSVMNQTLDDIEIICINDGSTDNSLAIMEELAKQDSRIEIIDKKNTGYGNSVNIGMARASGEYISIVESDDFISEKMYETLYSLSFDGEADVIKANFYSYYENGKKAPKIIPNDERNMIEDSKVPFTLRENPQISWGHPSVWSAIYRREFLVENNIEFIEAKGGGWVDNPFFYETLCKAKKIMWTNEPLYYYLRTNQTSSSNLQKDAGLPFVRMMDNFDVLEKNNYNDSGTLRCAYARALMYLIGALKDFDYDANEELITEKAKELMRRINPDILLSDFNLHDQLTYFTYASPIKNIKSKFPKILIYNWLPFDNPWNWGGGVTVYCRNVIDQILKSNPEINIYFLSSGFAYDASTDEIFVRKIGNKFGERVHSYEVVNSPIPADQRNIYINPLIALENPRLKKVISDFISRYGFFEAIHFNNIEGLSLDVFDLKKDYPKTKFIFSIHNYIPVCLNGFYYMRHKHCCCNPKHTAEDCFKCSRMDIKSKIADETYNKGLVNIDANDAISKNRWIKAFGFERLDEEVEVEKITDFAKTATQKINENCDSILAVSKRVYDIAADNGFDKSKMLVSYIGTKVADKQIGHAACEPTKKGLKIVFLGNDINYEEKGYPFLLDALSKMELKYASKIDLVLTVRQAEHAEIYTMLKNFRSIRVIQGYTHDDLEWIFEGANLSLVPVLWEDNLPQIAIESAAYGVPVLASSAGGASELCDSELFKFECGDSEGMLKKIMYFVDNPDKLKEYWKHHNGLVTMKQHWEELSGIYGITDTKPVEIPLKDYAYLVKENEFLHKHISLNEDNFTPQPVLEDLRRKLHEANKENERLKSELKEMEKYNGKIIFQCDYDPIQGNVGANLFGLTLEDFDYSDFYAEIKFVRLENASFSFSDTLRISGTWHNSSETDEHGLVLHQIDWNNGDSNISDNIYYYVRNNTIYFFAKYTSIYSGFTYEIETLTSRAPHDSVSFEKLSDTFIFEADLMPEDAFNA